MTFDLKARTILLTVFGSRAYGMHRPGSDVDLRGVCVPTRPCFTGFRQRFEQADHPDEMAVYLDTLTDEERVAADAEGKIDGAVYGIHKFFDLAQAANPNILEALFCREEEVRIITPAGRKLRERRSEFLSRRALQTFSGYARSQLGRIERHRRWLLEPQEERPTRAAFGLTEPPELPKNQMDAVMAAIRKRIDQWELDLTGLAADQRIYVLDRIEVALSEMGVAADRGFAAAARTLGYSENFIDLLDRERRYREALKDYKSYQGWKRSRNPARAALEAEHGYDTKHAAHLVRLLSAAREIVTEGTYTVYRPDAEWLLSIRDGAWSYEALIEWADTQHAELKALARKSALPATPDAETLDALCMEIVDSLI